MAPSSRLHPRPDQPSYLLLRTLAAQLRAELRACWPEGGPLAVLDLGCGEKPYAPLFAGAQRYVGVDGSPGPHVDVVAAADALPFGDGEFDCVLCSQVLEHVPDPVATVAEARRVLRPGGVLLLSTHGVAPYHANPEDYWRWTHAGLQKLLDTSGAWSDVRVHANGGPAGTLAYLASAQLHAAGPRLVARGLTLALNAGAWHLDRRIARPGRLPALSPNYLVRARRST